MTHVSKQLGSFLPGVPNAAADVGAPERIKPLVTTDSWANVNGSWGTAADWSTGVPTSSSAVVLSSAAAHTVTFGTNSTIYSLVSTTDTLNMTSGKLTITNGGTFGAALSVAGATLALGVSGSMSGGVTLGANGAIQIAAGATDAVTGTLSAISNYGTIAGPGTLTTAGTTSLAATSYPLLLGSGLTWINSGTVTDGAYIGLGVNNDTSKVAINNQAGGVFNMTGGASGLVLYSETTGFAATFTNAGLLESTGNGNNEIDANLVNTGTINVGSGTLELTGGGSLGGVVAGAGVLDLYDSAFTSTTANFSGLGGITVTYLGTLTLGGASGTVSSAIELDSNGAIYTGTSGGGLVFGSGVSDTLSGGVTFGNYGGMQIAAGDTETLSGGLTATGYNNTIAGPGTLSTSGPTALTYGGPALIIGNGLSWNNTGTVTDTGYIGLGINGDTTAVTINNQAGGVFNLSADGSGVQSYSPSTGFVAAFNNAGVLEMTGGTNDYISATLSNTGTILVTTGTLHLTAGGSIGNHVSGAGALSFEGAAYTSTSTVLSALGGIAVAGAGTLTLSGASKTLSPAISLSYCNSFYSGGGLVLGSGVSDTLSGGVTFGSYGGMQIASGDTETISGGLTATGYNNTIAGPGTLSTSGPTALTYNGPGLIIGNGLTWNNTGTVTDTGYIGLGINGDTTAVTINNQAGGVFNLSADGSGVQSYSPSTGFVAAFNNTGVLEMTGGTNDYIGATLSNTGSIVVTTGTLNLTGGGTIGGSIVGAGTLDFGGGSFTAGVANLASVANLVVGGGALTINGASGTLTGAVSINSGGTLGIGAGITTTAAAGLVANYGTLVGPGTLVTGGASVIGANNGNPFYLGNGATWTNTGTVTDQGYVYLGVYNNGTYDSSTVTLNNAAGAVFNMTGSYDQIYTQYATGNFSATFNNAGLLEATGTTSGYMQFTLNNTGTIAVTSGSTLTLAAGGSLGGVATGAGTLDLGGGSFTAGIANLAAVGNLEIGGGLLTVGGASGTLTGAVSINGGTLGIGTGNITTVAAGLVATNGTLVGPGILVTGGASVIGANNGNPFYLGNGATWTNTGTVTDQGYVYLGVYNNGTYDSSTVTLNNAAGAVYDLTGNYDQIYNQYTTTGFSATFNNAGMLEATGTTSATMQIALNNTGTVTVAAGSTLTLESGGSLGGVMGASGKAASLLLNSGGSFTASGLTITDDGTYSALTVYNGTTLTNTGTTTLNGKLTLGAAAGASAGLVNQAGGLLVFADADATIATSGSYAISNAGIFRDSAGGTLALASKIANTGTLLAASGDFKLSTVTGTGTLQINAGATLETATGVASTQAIVFAGGGGATLKQDTPASVKTAMAGFGAGDRLDLAGATISSAVVSGTTLSVVASTGSYTYLSNASLAADHTTTGSDGSGGGLVTLYREAVASATPQPLSFGNVHVGATGTATLTVTNTAVADGYSEALDASVSGVSGGITASGSVSQLAAGASSMAIGFTDTATSTAGAITAGGTLAVFSDGTGIDGYGTTALAPQTLGLTGGVYRYAAPSTVAAVSLGVVHVGDGTGDVVLGALTIANTDPADGYSEALDGTWGTAGSGVSVSGGLVGLAAGGTNTTSLLIGLSTAGSGSFSGMASLGLASDGAGIDNLGTTALASQMIAVSETVDNYAVAAFTDTGGLAITGSGTNFAINLGAQNEGSAALSVSLGALNAATGLADLLQGTLGTSGGTNFSNSGFGTFSGLAAGQSETNQGVTLGTANAGTFTETVTLTSSGTNTSGYNGVLPTETLTITGTILPPGTMTTYTLAIGSNSIVGKDGGDVFQGVSGSINSHDNLTGGVGANSLVLMGAGLFDIGAPATFSNIPTIVASEGQAQSGTLASTVQTVFMRNGANETLNVTAGKAAVGNANVETIAIYDGTGNDIFNLSTGVDQVYLGTGTATVTLGGASNQVIAGGGTATVLSAAATGGAALVGSSSGSTTLQLTSAGTLTLNAADTHLTVQLEGASKLTLGKGAFITGSGIAGTDTIVAGGVSQTLVGGVGDSLTGYAGFGDTFLGTSGELNGDKITNFGGSDVIDVSDLIYGSLTDSYSGTAKSGTLTLSDGTHNLAITMVGSYTLASFHFGTDGQSGTNVTFI